MICGLYYWAWIYLLPKFGHYQIRQETLVLGEGATTHRLVKVPNEKLAAWDETHDAVGRELGYGASDEKIGKENPENQVTI